jgi:chaperone required for assembly of F1-ATPase
MQKILAIKNLEMICDMEHYGVHAEDISNQKFRDDL